MFKWLVKDPINYEYQDTDLGNPIRAPFKVAQCLAATLNRSLAAKVWLRRVVWIGLSKSV